MSECLSGRGREKVRVGPNAEKKAGEEGKAEWGVGDEREEAGED